MVQYRRNRIEGGTYFFTVALRDRNGTLLVDWIDTLREVVRSVRHERPFHIDAWVVLPDHLHAMWRLPEGDFDYSVRWQSIKARFTRALAKADIAVRRNSKGEGEVWQRRYWEHTIRDELDYERHVNYVHYNPVKHGLVGRVCDWPHSTFHRYARAGLYSVDWGGGVMAGDGGGGVGVPDFAALHPGYVL